MFGTIQGCYGSFIPKHTCRKESHVLLYVDQVSANTWMQYISMRCLLRFIDLLQCDLTWLYLLYNLKHRFITTYQ